MKRFFSLIMFLIIAAGGFCTAAEAYTIEGSVSYTVERARKEAFANVEYTIPQEIIDSNLVDPNFKANKKAMKNGVTETSDRIINHFTDGTYCIAYKNNLYFEFAYSSQGNLTSINKNSKLSIPLKKYKYNTKNELISVVFDLGPSEVYTFAANGQFVSRWIGKKCYNNSGIVILERR